MTYLKVYIGLIFIILVACGGENGHRPGAFNKIAEANQLEEGLPTYWDIDPESVFSGEQLEILVNSNASDNGCLELQIAYLLNRANPDEVINDTQSNVLLNQLTVLAVPLAAQPAYAADLYLLCDEQLVAERRLFRTLTDSDENPTSNIDNPDETRPVFF